MTWFNRLPDSVKSQVAAISALGAAFMAGGMAFLFLGGFGALPERMDTVERSVTTVERSVRVLERQQAATERRSEYTLCLLEALTETGRRSASQCALDYGRSP